MLSRFVNSVSFSGDRMVAITFQPSFENLRAEALLMPEEVPVIKIVLFIFSSFS
jgi:hypothetical protein